MDRRWLLWALALLAPAPAAAACQVGKIAELPVTMAGRRPLVTAQFGGKATRFILDSGAFYSTISRASAAEFGLPVEDAMSSFRLKGVGGDTAAGIATAKDFSLAGIPIGRTEFVVGGSDTGTAGLLGQNVLGAGDVEYDLPHGMVGLFRVKGCEKMGLAYWAGTKPFTMLPLIDRDDTRFRPHTVTTILLNGVKIKALFDTGAESSVLTLAAAKRAGITPDSPGVTAAGLGSGLGSRQVRSWLATFASIDIGGEVIAHPRLHLSDVDLGGPDMLIGADFFLTHRLFVSNANRMMYVTYEGGPLFGLTPRGAKTTEGKAIDLADTGTAPTDASGYSRRGAVLASNHKLDAALADVDRAIALAPGEGRYVYQRAMIRLQNRQPALAAADLDRAVELSPGDAEVWLTRAQVRIAGARLVEAAADLNHADTLLAPSSDQRLTLATLLTQTGGYDGAVASFDLWLKSHPADSDRGSAFNGRCWARGLANRELDAALADCDRAVKVAPGDAAYLDSRALVRLRRGELALALADYDRAIGAAPRNAWSLYARSIAAKRAGKTAQATADRAAALAINPRVAERARAIHLEE